MRDVVGIQTAWLFMLCYSWNGKVSKATKTSTYEPKLSAISQKQDMTLLPAGSEGTESTKIPGTI